MHTKKRKSICLLLATCPLFGLIGCSGLELGGKLGVYAVDERQESQRTYKRPQALKCLFISCSENNDVRNTEGS